jgi:hypothetical protein
LAANSQKWCSKNDICQLFLNVAGSVPAKDPHAGCTAIYRCESHCCRLSIRSLLGILPFGRSGEFTVSYDSRHRRAHMVGYMERENAGELEGQTSINELLNESVGVSPIQMVLPLHVQVASGEYRRL